MTTSRRRKPTTRRRRSRVRRAKADSGRAREVLFARWRLRATRFARKIVGATRAVIADDELESAAMWGLLQAIDKFNPEKGARFGTYLYHKVRSAVYDHIRYAAYRADRSRVRFHSLEYLEELRRNAVVADDRRGCGQQAARECAAQLGLGSASDSAVLRLTEAPEKDTAADRHERAELVALAMLALKYRPRLRKVVRLYFYENKTLREVGTVMSFSEHRAMDLLHQALRMMRRDLDARGIGEGDVL